MTIMKIVAIIILIISEGVAAATAQPEYFLQVFCLLSVTRTRTLQEEFPFKNFSDFLPPPPLTRLSTGRGASSDGASLFTTASPRLY